MASVTINGITLDPADLPPDRRRSDGGGEGPEMVLAAFAEDAAPSEDPAYLLIQVTAPLDTAMRALLEGLGVELLEYLAPLSFMARRNAAGLTDVAALDFVHWAGPYTRHFKIHAHLQEAIAAAADGEDGVFLRASTAGADGGEEVLHEVDALLHRGVSGEQAAAGIAAAVGLSEDAVRVASGKLRFRASAAQIERLARLDEVRHLELVPRADLCNDVAVRIIAADRAHAPEGGGRWDGAGEVIAVADTGFDQGSTANVHPAFAGRVRRLYALGRSETASDPHGHGTHVAGSALGDGVTSGGIRVAGSAPAAQLVVQSLLDHVNALGGLPMDMGDLLRSPYVDEGARVHSNSWALDDTRGAYVAYARELDDFVWRNRDMVVCVAAGNSARDGSYQGVVELGSVQAPGTAKNCITVGASESLRVDQSRTWGEAFPKSFPIPPIANDQWANSADGLAAFSGRGPTKDGRIKPDVVAPGTSILSAMSGAVAQPDVFWGESNDPLYCYRGGTSMATPLVSGCAAVIRQYLVHARGIARPSAALVKAMLIAAAVTLRGHYVPSDSGPRRSFDQGFGRVDLAGALGLAKGGTLELHDEGEALAGQGDERHFDFLVPPDAVSLGVTLVWTDPPGERLVNDLDLIVRAGGGEGGGGEWHGNMAEGSADFDRVNNVEEVIWPAPPAGPAQVVVRAHDVPLEPQSFALVIRILT